MEADRCIFCFREEPRNSEHVFAKAIGGSFTLRCACSTCNGTFGTKIDTAITNHPLSLIERQRLEIKGYSGSIPETFTHGVMTHVDGDDVPFDIKIRNLIDSPGAPWRLEVIPTISKTTNAERTDIIKAAFPTEAEARKWMRKELARQGVTCATEEEFERICAASITSVNVDQPTANFAVNIPTDSGVLRKALLKIVYEMAWYWLGKDWLSDSTAKKIRKVLRGSAEGQLPLRGILGLVATMSPFPQLLSFLHIAPHEHSAIAFRIGSRIVVVVTIFNRIVAAIAVTDNAERYRIDDIRQGTSPLIILDAHARTYEFDTFAARATRSRTRRSKPGEG